MIMDLSNQYRVHRNQNLGITHKSKINKIPKIQLMKVHNPKHKYNYKIQILYNLPTKKI